jgi:hypothetical protein
VLAEVVHTVDLVLHAGIVRRGNGARQRKLLSVGCVAGLDDGRPIVQELVALRPDGLWHRVGSPGAMPDRVWSKLEHACEPARLLDGFDA